MIKALRVVPSPVLQLSEDGKKVVIITRVYTTYCFKVTRVEPFKPANKEQVEARTIYVENLPSDADHESLTKVGFAHFSFWRHFFCVSLSLYFRPNF